MAELPNSIKLEIVTPGRLLFSGDVDSVTVPGLCGYMGILPGHAPLLSELKIGVISYRRGATDYRIYSEWGFVEVLPDRVSVLVETAETPAEIDIEQARAMRDQAEQVIRSKGGGINYQEALTQLEAALTRLSVAA